MKRLWDLYKKASLGTLNVANSVLYGGLRGLEGIADAVTYGISGIIGGVGELTGHQGFKDAANNLYKATDRNLIGELYNVTGYQKSLDVIDDNSLDFLKQGTFLSSTAESIGGTLARLPLGTAGIVLGVAGGSTEEAANTLSEREGRDLTATERYRTLGYGAASGLLSAGIESISGGIGGLEGGLAQKGFRGFAKNVLGEGLEEAVEEVVGDPLKHIYDDQHKSTVSKIITGDTEDIGEHLIGRGKEIGMSALGGMVSSGIMQGGQALRSNVQGNINQKTEAQKILETPENQFQKIIKKDTKDAVAEFQKATTLEEKGKALEKGLEVKQTFADNQEIYRQSDLFIDEYLKKEIAEVKETGQATDIFKSYMEFADNIEIKKSQQQELPYTTEETINKGKDSEYESYKMNELAEFSQDYALKVPLEQRVNMLLKMTKEGKTLGPAETAVLMQTQAELSFGENVDPEFKKKYDEKIRKAIQEHKTHTAQTLKAFDSNILDINRVLQNYESDLDKIYSREYDKSSNRAKFTENKARFELTESKQQQIREINAKMIDMLSQVEDIYLRQEIMAQAKIDMDAVAYDGLPKKLSSQLKAIRNVSFLLNFKTQARNILSNVGMVPLNILQKGTANIIDRGIAIKTGKRTSAGNVLDENWRSGSIEGFDEVWEQRKYLVNRKTLDDIDINKDTADSWKRGHGDYKTDRFDQVTQHDVFDIYKRDKQGNKLYHESGKPQMKRVSQSYGVGNNTVNFLLNLGDKPFFNAYHKSAFKGLVEANTEHFAKIEADVEASVRRDSAELNLTDKQINKWIENQVDLETKMFVDQLYMMAKDEAATYVFQNDSKTSEALNRLKEALNSVNIKGYGLGDIITPYIKTPANVASTMYHYSPAGLINAIVKGYKMWHNIQDGTLTMKEQKSLVETTSKALTGSLLYIISGALVGSGVISLGSDKDQDKAGFDRDIKGENPFSINFNINGKKHTATYDWLVPWGTAVKVVATMKQQVENKANFYDGALEILKVFGDDIMSQASMETLKTLFTSDEPISTVALRIVPESIINTIIPQQLSHITRAIDDKERETYDPTSALKTLVNKAKSRVPGLSQTLEPRRDTLGREVEKGAGRRVAELFSPTNIRTANETDLTKEIERVYEATGNKDVFPHKIRTIEEDKALSPKERGKLQEEMGANINDMLTRLFNTPEYQKANDNGKATLITRQVNKLKRDMREQIQEERTDTEGVSGEDYSTYDSYTATKKGLREEDKDGLSITKFNISQDTGISADLYNQATNLTGTKESKFDKINSMELSKGQKAVLLKMLYPRDTEFDELAFDYINGLQLSKEDKSNKLRALGVINDGVAIKYDTEIKDMDAYKNMKYSTEDLGLDDYSKNLAEFEFARDMGISNEDMASLTNLRGKINQEDFIAYLDQTNLELGQRLVLFKYVFNTNKLPQLEEGIIDYLNTLQLSREEKIKYANMLGIY